MSETKETPDKAPAAGARKPLSLKRTETSGHVQQSFSHGRKNVVVVERKKRRTLTGPGQGEEEPRGSREPAPAGDEGTAHAGHLGAGDDRSGRGRRRPPPARGAGGAPVPRS